MSNESSPAAARPSRADLARWKRFLDDECDGAALYRALAAAEPDPTITALYLDLAEAEERHAAGWAARLGVPVPTRISIRARLTIAAIGRLGPDLAERMVAAREQREIGSYEGTVDPSDPAQAALLEDEHFHAFILDHIARVKRGSTGMARLGNALRAAVLGVTDGLVSNVSLIMGVVGAHATGDVIVLTGVAGLLAGALSMGLGEWLSVQSSRELYERQKVIAREALIEERNLARAERVFHLSGLTSAQAEAAARRIVMSGAPVEGVTEPPAGDDEADLGGSAWVAALTSFLMFAAGSFVPVVPFLIGTGSGAVIASLAVTGAVLFMMGAGITILTGKPALKAGLRQLAIGAVAAAITYGVGHLFNATVG